MAYFFDAVIVIAKWGKKNKQTTTKTHEVEHIFPNVPCIIIRFNCTLVSPSDWGCQPEPTCLCGSLQFALASVSRRARQP